MWHGANLNVKCSRYASEANVKTNRGAHTHVNVHASPYSYVCVHILNMYVYECIYVASIPVETQDPTENFVLHDRRSSGPGPVFYCLPFDSLCSCVRAVYVLLCSCVSAKLQAKANIRIVCVFILSADEA